MNRNYSCKICDEYCSNHVSQISKHLLKKKQSMSSIKSFNYSNDQLIILSLIPDKDIDNLNIKINNIHKNNNIISKNKLELLDNIKLIINKN